MVILPLKTLRILRRTSTLILTLSLLAGTLLTFVPQPVAAEGSRNLYPEDIPGSRGYSEWRTSTYGLQIFRRTLMKVYASQGEVLLLGSSAIGVGGTPDNGDIRVYNPDLVTGEIGQEILPATPSFSCREQRTETGNAAQGRIGSRQQELSGPDTIINAANATPGGVIVGGYVPCFYTAPADGIYTVVFFGPAGPGLDTQNLPTGSVANPRLGPDQNTAVAMWDITVRANLTATDDQEGRAFTYYLTLFTGGNGRQVYSTIYVTCFDGFIYKVDLRGMDPNGFVIYANQVGFLDSDGSPLYRNVLAQPDADKQEQNQLSGLQGGVSLAPPQFPIFFSTPDPLVLETLGIPLEPTVPGVTRFTFTGPTGEDFTAPEVGGTFRFSTTENGVYEIVISRDGTNFDPTAPQNRVLRGVLEEAGTFDVEWNGTDNSGEAFPIGDFVAAIEMHGGEIHFPFLDVENSIEGGPVITLTNPPGGVCPFDNPDCTTGFYDDRGYLTADGTLVGVEINGPLCPGNVGNPPDLLFSDPINGFDTTTGQRAFGFLEGGNPPTFVCDPAGGFGDKKGLDIWTYYPSAALVTPVIVGDPTYVELTSFTATPTSRGIRIDWETSVEIDTWGFHLLRSADGTRAGARRITTSTILAEGRGHGGERYAWTDSNVASGVTYTYWLQEMELSGRSNEYGPVRARAYEDNETSSECCAQCSPVPPSDCPPSLHVQVYLSAIYSAP